MEARIYVADLAAYNEGFLLGKWIDLPAGDLSAEVEELLEETSKKRREILKIAEDDEDFCESEEWAIHDYEGLEWYGNVSEYENLDELNEACELYSNLDDQDAKKVSFLMDIQNYSMKDALDKKDDCSIYEDMNFSDLAEMMVDEGCFGDIPDSISNYIDYDAIGRDLSYDYTEYGGDIFRCD